MASKKLKTLLLVSILIVYLHFGEEVIAGFYHNDWIMRYFSSFFHSINEAQYYSSHITWLLLIGPTALLALGGKWTLRILTLYGLVFIFELHHLIDAVRTLHYYPGMVTTIAYEIVGIFYWKELLNNWRKSYGTN